MKKGLLYLVLELKNKSAAHNKSLRRSAPALVGRKPDELKFPTKRFYKLNRNVVKCEDMKRKEFVAKDVLDEWKCFLCLEEKPDLEVFAEDDARIYLICASCRKENEKRVRDGLASGDF